MKHLMVLGSVLLAALALSGSATTQPDGSELSLDQYKATVSPEVFRDLEAKGLDIVAAEQLANGKVEIDAVLSKEQVLALRAKDIDLQVRRNEFGQSARQFAALQAVNDFVVWDDYDSPDGHRAQLYEIAEENPQLTKLVVLEHTIQGRELIALKVTQGARGIKDGKRPAVLYTSTQHAREWIAPEVNSRLLNYFVDQWRAGNQEIRKLLRKNEYWFVIVANPDGYQYTFASEDTRLWRKNLRDNNANGTIEVGDGVDPNRNYPEHFKYDEEGSSSIPSSETYRGTAPGSEAETRAIMRLYDRVDFVFHVNWHSAGQWLLYPEGWQTATPTADDPIYFALSGNLDNPAIPEFHPGLSSDVLYVTNGETTDFAHSQGGALAWTPELSEGCEGCGFVFPDDEALVQAEFERNLAFALDVAKSAGDPDDPVSHLGLETKPFYFKSDDTYKTGVPGANFTFAVSYGDPQEIRILAKKAVDNVRLKYRIDDGRVRSTGAFKWRGGDTYGGQTDVYYEVLRGFVRGTKPGDEVTVWFEGKLDEKGKKGKRVVSDSFTYTAAVESRNDVLILSAEDYTGASPVQATGPNYLSYYQDALEENDIGYDVYDVDANGRQAATMLGVLSHYDAVIWYTGDDVITREPGWGPGNASRLAMDELLHVREYLNEGGKALWTGKHAGFQYSTNQAQAYDPTAENAQCSALPDTVDPRRCLFLGGSGDLQNDVLEYWFGGYLLNFGAGLSEDNIFDVLGVDTPFDSLTLMFNGADSAQNGDNANSFIATSGILPPDEFPQFESWVSARYDRPGGPFDPHTGDSYVYSQIADVSYKRLTRSIAVPAGDPAPLSFWTSYNTEAAWDHLFVEAIDAAGNRTTLPSAFTTTATGDSCAAGWHELHPWLEEYQGADCSGPKWNAASGNSQGWQEWLIDLDAYNGQTVEISISYASDWAVQGLGVFVDDITLPDGSFTSFEGGDTGGWTVPGPPPGSASNVNDFVFTTAAGFPEGATITTEDTLLLGFGFEAITGADTRADVMGRAMDYLLDD
ncbi:MAG: M14 family zinc carboxypeptidase [Gaiellaceae bacterium]